MPNTKLLLSGFAATLSLLLVAGCQSGAPVTEAKSAPAATAPAAPAAPTAPAAAAAPAAVPAAPVVAPAPAAPAAPALPAPPVRIKAGPGDAFKDAEGNPWLIEQGFADGETAERPDLQVGNTRTPALYLSERYSMTAFSYPVPNGKYTVRLHFCETYEGITAPGERVFTFNVEGREFKDFDVFVKAGGSLRAYIETVNVEVADGKLDITFTPQVENPEINGIEILPGS
jgi:nucleoid-associated protein YgaU